MDGGDPWPEWIRERHRALSERSYGHELRFVENVLRRIPDIDPSWVTHEFPFQDSNGRNRRVDFVLQHWSLQRPIAIEVDGGVKGGRVKSDAPPTKAEHDDFVVRQNALTSLGFCLLRFTNAQVRSNPVAIRKEISEAIATEQLAARRLRGDVAPTSGVRSAASEGQAPYGDDRAGVGADAVDHAESVANVSAPNQPARRPMRWAWAGVAALAITVAAVAASWTDPQDATATHLGVPPVADFLCPDAYPVKGNESQSTGDLIYHVPSGQFYDRTNPVRCYRNEADAQAAGYRASQR